MSDKFAMSPERFFDLFLKELEQREDMYHYYKFLENDSKYNFRRNYFLERLKYVANRVNNPEFKIWDCGCGYGTTALFLAMNGIKVHGTTLEFYAERLQERYQYWNNFGDASLFTCSYENLFDEEPAAESYDQIIIQDTLHHLEPINDALKIFHKSLKAHGELVLIEENGNNIIQNFKLYLRRGNKRVIQIWDEKLQKKIWLGNENIRSLKDWEQLFENNGFKIPHEEVRYVRYYLPFRYKKDNAEKLLEKEKELQKKHSFKREYLFFGLNFIGVKK